MMGWFHKSGRVSALAVTGFALLSLTAAAPASAIVLYDSEGFEDPTFAQSDLEGQDPTDGPWATTTSQQNSTAVVTDEQSFGGDQSVRVTRAVGEDQWWLVEKPTKMAGEPLSTAVVEWRMMVPSSAGTPGTHFGPFFGIEVVGFDSNGDLYSLARGGADATTSDVLYDGWNAGGFAETGDTFSFGQWHHYELVVDFSLGSFDLYFDGSHAATDDFMKLPLAGGAADSSASITHFNEAAIATLFAGHDIGGTAYFDDYNITLVPEPGSVTLLGTAAALILLRRRRHVAPDALQTAA